MPECVTALAGIHSGQDMIAGVDEVGRGPLAGPVVAAAVILDPRLPIAGLRDSKEMSPRQRQDLACWIRRRARAFAIGFASVQEIDALNILQASLLAMERAVLKLKARPALLRIDGRHVPRFDDLSSGYRAEPIIGGDRTDPSISAASILAKVCRDRLLIRLHRRYPHYGWDSNKGYPTALHLQALERYGPCEQHRRSFGPVRRLLDMRPPP